MNQRQPYELTIAEKLELLTVPDMVDAIWARIEFQLDIDMPTDDGPPEPPATPGSGPGNWVSAGFLIALITILFFTQFKKQKKNEEISIDQPVIETSAPETTGSPPLDNSPGIQSVPDSPYPRSRNTTEAFATTDSVPVSIDSNVMPVSLPGDSSLAEQSVPSEGIIPPPLADPKTDPLKKKGRGVKGISEDDYRIVPKKDSSG